MTTSPTATLDAATAAVQQVLAGLDALASVPGWQLPDEALGAAVAGLDQVARRAEAQSVRLAAEAGQRGLPGQQGHGRLASWVQAQHPTTNPRTAIAQARRAEALYLRPSAVERETLREAALDGRVTGEHVDVVLDAVQELTPPAVPPGIVDHAVVAEAQQVLLAEAERFAPRQLRRLASRVIEHLDPAADERLARDERARERARGLILAPLPSGMVQVDGLLTPPVAAALTTAIDAWSAPQPAADGTPDPRTASQRRHDGLGALAAAVVAHPNLLSTNHGSPYRVLVHVPHDTLATALAGSLGAAPGSALGAARGRAATLVGGSALSAATLGTLACDAEIVPVLLDRDGVAPLDVGRTQRSFTARQRTALTVRDRHCTWPGCTAEPAWCDAHHLTPWQHGGRTDLANAALLCSQHHHHVHASGGEGRVVEGRVVEGQVRWNTGPPGRPGPPPTPTGEAALTRATRLVDDLARRWRLRPRQ